MYQMRMRPGRKGNNLRLTVLQRPSGCEGKKQDTYTCVHFIHNNQQSHVTFE
jgi:hypothetical protein